MTTLIQLVAAALRIGGTLAGVTASFLIPDSTLVEAISAAGGADMVSLAAARMAAHAAFGALGLVIASQVAGFLLRGPSIPPGTRTEAAESVPRLRRHLVGGAKPVVSAMLHYLDPDPAPTKPVAVSFKDLGLEHPHPDEYPAAGGKPIADADDLLFRERQKRPDNAGSASDEWDDIAPAPERSQPGPPHGDSPPAGSAPRPDVEAVSAAADQQAPSSHADRAAETVAPGGPASAASAVSAAARDVSHAAAGNVPMAEGVGATSIDEDDSFEPWPDAPRASGGPSPRPSPTPYAPLRTASPAATAAQPGRSPATTEAAPSFAMSAVGGGSDWYGGTGDEEDDAEDDGAGYGSLANIGLGKSHAPRPVAGQRGEAGLPAALYAGPSPTDLVPHGKPQDFRLREALSELRRLDPSLA